MAKMKLSNSELEVMRVFWKSDQPLATTDLPKVNPQINVNTAAVAVKNLLKKNFIQVADITYHGSSLTRVYRAAITSEDYLVEQFSDVIASPFSLMSALVQREKHVANLDKLAEMIQAQKDMIKGE